MLCMLLYSSYRTFEHFPAFLNILRGIQHLQRDVKVCNTLQLQRVFHDTTAVHQCQCQEHESLSLGAGCRPLETAHTAPQAKVDPHVYMPPQLREGAAGWYPEYGKPWENWYGLFFLNLS